MAHFAQLDKNNLVLQVIVVNNSDTLDQNGQESEAVGVAFCKALPSYGKDTIWMQTSYNASFRKNYAGMGYTYDPVRDAFIEPTPHPSWLLDEKTCRWVAPVAEPNDGKAYRWDEDTLSWVEVPILH